MRLDTRRIAATLDVTGAISEADAHALLKELHATRGEIDRALIWHERGQSWAAMNYLQRFMKG